MECNEHLALGALWQVFVGTIPRGHLSVKVLYHQNVDAFFLSSNKPIPQVGPVVARWAKGRLNDDPHVDGVESPLNVARGGTHFRCEELTRLEPYQLRENPRPESKVEWTNTLAKNGH